MNKIRILVLTHQYLSESDYMSGFIHDQVNQLMLEGCEPVVVVPTPYSPRFLWFKEKWKDYGQQVLFDIKDEIPIYYPRYICMPGKWFHSMSSYAMRYGLIGSVDAIIGKIKPNIIYAYTATPDGYMGLLLKKKYNIPLVCSLRGSDINVYPEYNRSTYDQTKKVLLEADFITSVSYALKKSAESISHPRREIQVIYNGCNVHEFKNNRNSRYILRKKLGISKQAQALIFVGGLLKEKGVHELLEAFLAYLSSIHPNLHLIYVGDGPEYQNISNTILSKKLSHRIHLVGGKPNSEINQWLSTADIFVFPSYFEGLPNAILEAMACGLPVVATDVGGIPEIVENGKSGILIGTRSANSIATAIQFLLENTEMRERMGQEGRNIIKNRFTWDRGAKELKKIYLNILKG
ncbi:hypothetical protein D1BOALGB6SA_8716 [Olavius sp. associated proteobacterium Delta 1]|nr:hypothetical protein D1BOALGB6SA_8716 [Olavius sp. associated proteobacterium Delta 1]